MVGRPIRIEENRRRCVCADGRANVGAWRPDLGRRAVVCAESMGYAVVLYLDALFAMLVILVIPFLREREERSAVKLVTAEPLLGTG